MLEHLADFLAYLRTEKGLAKNTLIAYQHDLESLSCSEITEESLYQHLSQMRRSGYSPSTMARLIIACKVFIRFLIREGIAKPSQALTVETPKLWQLIPEIMSVEEVDLLLKAPDPSTFMGARDRAILEMLYGSGLRVSELCMLKINDLDDETVRVIGKGDKERIVPVGRKAIEAVDHYLGQFRQDGDLLFVSNKGKPMDRVQVWRMIKKYGKSIGVEKRISPHTLRHSFATHLLENGAELRVIQEMLGHASIATTDRYTQISQRHVKTAFERYHPKK